jgi:hypothetical protein
MDPRNSECLGLSCQLGRILIQPVRSEMPLAKVPLWFLGPRFEERYPNAESRRKKQAAFVLKLLAYLRPQNNEKRQRAEAAHPETLGDLRDWKESMKELYQGREYLQDQLHNGEKIKPKFKERSV